MISVGTLPTPNGHPLENPSPSCAQRDGGHALGRNAAGGRDLLQLGRLGICRTFGPRFPAMDAMGMGALETFPWQDFCKNKDENQAFDHVPIFS